MMSTTLAAVVAKLAALSIPAKAAVGVAVAAGAVGGVPVVAHQLVRPTEPEVALTQEAEPDTAEAAVEDVDATPTGSPTDPVAEEPDEVPADEDGEEGDPTDDPTETPVDPLAEQPVEPVLPESSSFGRSVAADAQDGGVDGREIAEQARVKPDAQQPERSRDAAPVQPAVPAPARPTAPAPTSSAPTEADVAPVSTPPQPGAAAPAGKPEGAPGGRP